MPMTSSPNSAERAYAYAKACGIIGKSFVGKRIPALAKPHSLKELDRLIFPDSTRELPGRELLTDLENRILNRTVRHITMVINSYADPPELLVRQLRACEYADVKTCLHHIANGNTAPPMLSDIGRFGTVHFEKYPDLCGMLAGTEFEFILGKFLTTGQAALRSAEFDFIPLEAELDLRYYTLLAASVRRLNAADRIFAEHILAEEISLRNCVWALRLRTYFNKKAGETEKYLLELKMQTVPFHKFEAIPGDIHPRAEKEKITEISLADEARESLFLPLDSRSEWKNWRWAKLLNPERPAEHWSADPRYFQNAASQYLYRLSLRCFRRMPSSIGSIFCYIKLKQFEEDMLTSTTEGLGLGMTGNDVFGLLEVPQ